jgi:hypothetical protein
LRDARSFATNTYMDDFKFGFPSPAKDTSHEPGAQDASKGGNDDDELDWGADEGKGEADDIVIAEPLV